MSALGCSGNLFDFIDKQTDSDIALVSYGAETEEALAACDLLLQKGVRADCCKLVRRSANIKPFCLLKNAFRTAASGNSFVLHCSKRAGRVDFFCMQWITVIFCTRMFRSCARTRNWMPRHWQAIFFLSACNRIRRTE